MKRITTKRHFTIILMCLAVLIIGCIQVAQRPRPEHIRIQTDNGFGRGLWVRAASLAEPDAIDRIIALCVDMGITDLYAQAVVAGYAYYRSEYLPRSQYLAEKSGPAYDPLAALIRAAKNHGIRVHAWVNCLLAWSLRSPPDSSRHIFYQHPDWFIKDVTGKNMVNYTYEEWMDAGLEGLYLDPAHPGVQDFLQAVCNEIAAAYPVDGIHLDFIRYPGTLWGQPDNDTAALLAGSSGHTTRWLTLSRYPRLDLLSRWLCWHVWRSNRQREDHIKNIVRLIAGSLTKNAPECMLTAAAFPNPSLARYRFCQNWTDWDTIMRYPVVMSYTPDRDLFEEFLTYVRTYRPDAHFGIGILWPHMAAIGYLQQVAVMKHGAPGVCYFDFTRIDTLSDYMKLKGRDIRPEDTLLIDTMTAPLDDPWHTDSLFSRIPGLSGHETTAEHILAFSEYLLSLSLDHEQDLAHMDMTVEEFIRHIQEDVSIFIALDDGVFPLPEMLDTPAQREVQYSFFPWHETDTTITIAEADAMREYEHTAILCPHPILPLSRAVFDAALNERVLCRARSGIYVFSVRAARDFEPPLHRHAIADTLLPFFLNQTAMQRARMIIMK